MDNIILCISPRVGCVFVLACNLLIVKKNNPQILEILRQPKIERTNTAVLNKLHTFLSISRFLWRSFELMLATRATRFSKLSFSLISFELIFLSFSFCCRIVTSASSSDSSFNRSEYKSSCRAEVLVICLTRTKQFPGLNFLADLFPACLGYEC